MRWLDSTDFVVLKFAVVTILATDWDVVHHLAVVVVVLVVTGLAVVAVVLLVVAELH